MSLFVDTTLRDGLQSPGVFLTRRQKLTLARKLFDAGFRDAEGGIPVRGSGDVALIRELSKTGLRIINWCRVRDEDLDAAEQSGTGAVHISGTCSDRMLGIIGREYGAMEEELAERVRRAGSRFGFVSAGLMDASRTPEERLVRMVGILVSAGADRIRLADTAGTATPRQISLWGSLLQPYLDRLEFHGHNDLGMATANAWCAVEAGFGAVSGTLCGIGERAGNTAWDQLIPALAVTGLPVGGIPPEKVIALSGTLRRWLGEEVPPRHPFTGSLAFAHESGIHVSGLLKDPLSFQCAEPERLGLPPARICYGTQSGSGAVSGGLKTAGWDPSPAEIGILLPLVSRAARKNRRPLELGEVEKLYQKISRRGNHGHC